MKKTEQSYTGWYFLGIVVLVYIIVYFVNSNIIINSLSFFIDLLKKIIPVLFLVIIFMAIINYFVKPKILAKYLNEKTKTKWLIATAAGIISTGPIYLWYPMLSELKDKGVKEGLIATFLYARAIKPALMPLMIMYFGLSFTIILSIVMVIFSIIQGLFIEKILGGKK